MNKILKKILITALAIVCALSLVACSDSSEGDNEKGLFCKKIGDVYTIYKYVDDGKTSTLDIAKALEEKEIDDTNIRIQSQAFNGNSSLKKIIVPNSVTKIEKGAFAGMKALEELTLPFVGLNANGDVSVGDTAPSADKAVDSERTIAHIFGDTSYEKGIAQTISYGTNTTTADDGSTTSQSTTCYIPASLNKIIVTGDKIPACAFNGLSKYVQIELTGSVKQIGDYAFANMAQLSEITLPTTIEKIGKGAFSGSAKLSKINLDKLTALTEISESAFENTALTEVKTPSSLVTIGKEAFTGCKELTKLTLNEGLKAINRYAFMGCEKLATIITDGITDNTIKVGNYAFADCSESLPTTAPTAFNLVGVKAYPVV